MKIRTNKILTRTLEQRRHDFITQNVPLPKELEKLIDSGFRTEDDCILLKNVDYFGQGLLDSDYKKTEYEDFENHIHIDDYTSPTTDEFEYLKVGLEFAKRIYKKLNQKYQNQFRITVSFSETTMHNAARTE